MNDTDCELLPPIAALLMDDARADVAIEDPKSEPLFHELWPFFCLETVEQKRSYYPSTTGAMAIAIALDMSTKIAEIGFKGFQVTHASPRRIAGP